MKKYELMTIFRLEDEKSKKGAEDVKGTLTKFGAEIEEEKPFGDRDLTYEIKKQKTFVGNINSFNSFGENLFIKFIKS